MSRAQDWVQTLAPLAAILGVLGGFWLLYQMAVTPVSTRVIPPSTGSSGSPVPSTYPPELLVAAIAISTSLAPSPEPTPEPYRTPTPPLPTIYCGINSNPGQSCQWPQPTIVATEMPVCLTPIPSSTCVWMGNRVGTPVSQEAP